MVLKFFLIFFIFFKFNDEISKLGFICLFKLQFEFVGTGVVTLLRKSDGPKYIWDIRSFLFENNTFISCADYPPLIVGTGVMTLLRKSDGPKYVWDIRSFLFENNTFISCAD